MPEKWRLIRGPLAGGAENMAIDEAILRSLESKHSRMPALRIYGWKVPTISIGFLQDASVFFASGLPVVRRLTGGRAVLHDMEVTYSIAAPSNHPLFSNGITSAYSVISGAIVEALNDIGVPAYLSPHRGHSAMEKAAAACFNSPSRHEVLVDGRKLAGSSQRRLRNSFLQHGSILFGVDEVLLVSVFGPKTIEKMAWVGGVKDADADMEGFKRFLIGRMGQRFDADFAPGEMTRREALIMEGLVETRYSNDGWNLRGAEKQVISYR
ncbi:MAG: lipoate--protein ligase family protein [Deltaproteobacteria bacterium]|nr:lipoate--protein ligase family protein [Deltaproteobacteria bacterium]